MSDALILGIIIACLVVIRVAGATLFFYIMLPDDGRCPNCDMYTVRVQSKGWNILLPWFRTSWCYNCGWEGLLRRGAVSANSEEHAEARHRNVGA